MLFAGVALAPTLLAGFLLLAGAPEHMWGQLAGDDPFEPNDLHTQAAELDGPGAYRDLTCGDDDVDWYAIDVPAGKALVVSADPSAESLGATSIHDAEGIPLATSRSSGWVDSVVWVPTQPGRHLIRVWGGRGGYTLDAQLVSPRRRYEPNDMVENAVQLEPGLHADLLCDGDDWYAVQVPPHRSLTAKVDGQVTQLGLELIDGVQVASVGTATPTLAHEASAPPTRSSRTVQIHVGGAQAGYDLELALSDPDPALLTSANPLPTIPGSFEPNDDEHRAQRIGRGVYPNLRCDGADWYLVEVPDVDTTLSVTIAFGARANLGLFFMEPYTRNSEQSQGDGVGAQQLQAYLPQGGNYYVHVYGDTAPYTMTVDTIPGPPGKPLTPGNYSINGTGDDMWRVDLKAGQTVMARCNFDSSRGDIDMVLANAEGNVDYSGGFGSTEQVTYSTPVDQPLFVRVQGPAMRYALTIGVSATPPGAAVTAGPGSSAQPLERGTYNSLTVKGEARYRIDLTAGQTLDVRMSSLSGNDWISGDIYDANDMSIAQSQDQSFSNTGNTYTLRHTAAADGPVFLVVWGTSSGGGQAPLRFNLTAAIDGRSEPDPTPLTPGVYGGQECPGNLLYAIPVKGGQRLVATIDFAHADGDLDLALVDEVGNELARSESTEDTERVEWVAPLDMTVQLRVYNSLNVFDLTVEIADE
jgi:hypothetical protein